MRTALFALVALAGAACATSPTTSGRLPFCMPCTSPCKSEDSCGAKVAEVKPPPPAPAPVAPPPAPKDPAATPTFSPDGSSFDKPQQVVITSATPGATIHYTTDGSTPTESSPVYTGPITVDKNTTVQAIAVASGLPASAPAQASYSITPPPPARVTVGKEKLELNEKVYFDTGKASIQTVSYSLLDEVAAALKSHDDLKHVEVEGHTDNTGKAKFNKTLSQERANAVRAYLVNKGVDESRLSAKGFGSEKPVDSNKTAKGREANRRVEFRILK